MNKIVSFFIVLGSLAGNNLSAQTLSLFEGVESGAEAPQQSSSAQGFPAESGTPAFTLRSNSRFGDEYRSVVLGRNGETIEVRWQAGEKIELSGYFGFTVVEVNARELSLQHPGSESCVANEAAGVRCADANTSVLSLATMSPLPSNGTAEPAPPDALAPGTEGMQPGGGEGVIMGPGAEQFTNPFSGVAEEDPQLSEAEMAARIERARNRAERLSQFQPQRINDEDVPPGMRVVRTPFGDRLVPVRE
jgi:hypothetical protein